MEKIVTIHGFTYKYKDICDYKEHYKIIKTDSKGFGAYRVMDKETGEILENYEVDVCCGSNDKVLVLLVKEENRTDSQEFERREELGLVERDTERVIIDFGPNKYDYDPDKELIEFFRKEEDKDGLDIYYLSIYNCERKRFTVRDWLIVYGFSGEEVYEDYLILQNPQDNKYFFWLIKEEGKSKMIFKARKNIVCLHGSFEYGEYFAVQDDKTGLWALAQKEGEITPYEFKEIKTSKTRIILCGENYERIFEPDVGVRAQREVVIEKGEKDVGFRREYEEIDVDKINNEFLYCRDGKRVDIKQFYMPDSIEWHRDIYTIECDSISLAEIKETYDPEYTPSRARQLYAEKELYLKLEEFIFVVERNGKFGMHLSQIHYDLYPLSSWQDKSWREDKTLVEYEYDKIEEGLKGLYTQYVKEPKRLYEVFKDPILHNKNITHNRGNEIRDSFYRLYKGDKFDVFEGEKRQIILTGCDDVKYVEETHSLIYTKDGKMGIIEIGTNNKNVYGYDDIKYLGNHFYLVTIGDKQGVLHDMEEFIKVDYETVQMGILPKQPQTGKKPKPTLISFCLEKADGNYDMVCYNKDKNTSENIDVSKYNDIQFYKQIIVASTNERTYIFNYRWEEMAQFTPNAKVVEEYLDVKCERLDVNGPTTIYNINNERFYYHMGTLINARYLDLVQEHKAPFFKSYESKNGYGYVFVSENDPVKFAEKCREVEKFSDEEFERQFVKLLVYSKRPARYNKKAICDFDRY